MHRFRPLASFIALFTMIITSGIAQELRLGAPEAGHFAALVLKSVRQEYPNKLDHVMEGPGQVIPPKALHPAFYGCFDWHSSVHGHWLLVRVLREFPSIPEASAIRSVLDEHLNPQAIGVELAYLRQGQRKSFERTYGWAWLLKLQAELDNWDNPDAARWRAALRPLADAFVERVRDFLPRQDYPIRTGVHPNTAFSLSLILDYAEAAHDTTLAALVEERARTYFLADREAPVSWEPSGEDFLSPSLEEAALMVRILPPVEAKAWLGGFLPGLMKGAALKPAKVSDRSDPKIVHLDGLNLSRARCLYELAARVKPDEPLRARLASLGDEHARASLPHLASGNYEGEHWLGTFAVHMLTARGHL
jgi:hypothetical protein